jgi:hypothetical protein
VAESGKGGGLGVDEQSKGIRVYWLDTSDRRTRRPSRLERNTYFDDSSASHLEGEHDRVITEKNADLPTPETTETQIIPARHELEAENDEGRGKRVRNHLVWTTGGLYTPAYLRTCMTQTL